MASRFAKNLYSYLIIFHLVSFANEADSVVLKRLPGMERYEIRNMIVLQPDSVYAIGKGQIIFWNGKTWRPFKLPLPNDDLPLPIVKIFSEENIWLFYRISESEYRTRILRYHNGEWRHIFSPAPYVVDQFAFLDQHSFIACGNWNSVFVCENDSIRVLPPPPGVFINNISAFGKSHFLALIAENEYRAGRVVCEYLNGEWIRHTHLPYQFQLTHFFAPDSGVFVDNSNNIYRLRRNENGHIDSVFIKKDEVAAKALVRKYKKTDTVERETWLVPHPDAGIPLKMSLKKYPIGKNEAFWIDENSLVYYSGPKNIGKGEIPHHLPLRQYALSTFTGGHMGVALYENREKETDVFLTSINDNEAFYRLRKNLQTYNENFLSKRGLIGASQRHHKFAAYDAGAFFADIDNDTDMDAIFAVLRGDCLLYENLGDDTFRDVTKAYNFKLRGRFYAIKWVDLDGDGKLDFAAGDDSGKLKIFKGDGFFGFTEITDKLGLSGNLERFLPAFLDSDNDGDADLLLFTRNGNIRYFTNLGINSLAGLPRFAENNDSPDLTSRSDYYTQSTAIGDYDNDGDFDLFLANRWTPVQLYENDGAGNFRDISHKLGKPVHRLAYGANWGDLDQDGDLDIFLTTLGKNYFYFNRNGRFFDIDSLSIPKNRYEYSMGSLLSDLDDDGDLDILVTNNEIGQSSIYENEVNWRKKMRIRAKCALGNTAGLGTKIRAYRAGFVGKSAYLAGFDEIRTNRGYSGSGLPEVVFFLPDSLKYDVQAIFPSGKEVSVTDVAADSQFTIIEPATRAEVIARWQLRGLAFLPHPGRPAEAFQIFLFLCVGLLANFYFLYHRWRARHTKFIIHDFIYWPKKSILFFNLALFFSVFILFQLTPPLKYFAPLLIILVIFLSMRQFVVEQLKSSDNLYELFESIQQFQHGNSGSGQLDKLLYLFNNLPDSAKKTAFFQQLLPEIKQYEKYTFLMLKELAAKTKKVNIVTHYSIRIKKCSQGIKYRLSQINKRKTIVPKIMRKTADQLNTILETSQSLKRNVETLIAYPLAEAIGDALHRNQGFTRITSNYTEISSRLAVIIPAQSLIFILDNLLQNALAAMKTQLDKKIDIQVNMPKHGKITIIISNNGPEIPSIIADKIFEPGFSQKGSSGLGLSQTKKILQQYDGDIVLLAGQNKSQTAFKLTLKVLSNGETTSFND